MTLRASLFSAICFLTACIVLQPSEAGPRPVPIMIGGEADLDACGAMGVVVGLNPQGDNFLAVRAGPGTHYAIRDRIGNKQQLALCDERGQWWGVVYSRDPGQDCGIGSPQADRKAYAGPCSTGWVHRRYVRVEAG